ncbi:zinc-binding alcohol dehydrogenase family protein [Noviherbaspirillum sedimenti]|uniref:Zinc-type alcohol dehydrogenase-like protein n=1 Tax=Noviherbaspirillum sedimenti TaxID=2320865 RepID=A0A3A3GJD7_9BURK|nr:zinc-binding alcohol dehydrogenase family protein [Noviherbaspirillum sedimenti]RJG02416.1 zinc-binding alcohol dehydrogenase family protein [Noviherbaspirillum sedimenti]
MKAIGILPGDSRLGGNALTSLELERPVPKPRDILVQVEAVSVNPLDIRMRNAPLEAGFQPRVLGWDCAGIVLDCGSEVRLFKPGDHVFYAGSITRTGTNAELHLVDERIVGAMPVSLDFAHAAALPLASLAAWEALFDRLCISDAGENSGKTLLVIGGSGGVGSVAIQLAKVLARLQVVATASRSTSQAWCRQLGADIVIDHRADLRTQLIDYGLSTVDYILCLADTDYYFSTMASLIKPHGHICALVESANPLPMNQLRSKSASFSWEGMFTRTLYSTPDMIEQHRILTRIATLVDEGRMGSIATKIIHGMTEVNLRQAHAFLEAGGIAGKIVISMQPPL